MSNLINYHGGVQLGRLSPMALFASITWADGTMVNWQANDWHLRCQVDTFFNDFLSSSYMDALRQYLVVPNELLWPGPYAGTTGISIAAQAAQSGTVTDEAIQAALQSAIQGGIVSYTTSPTFYCVLVPPGIPVIDRNGRRSDDLNAGFGGYHGVFQGPKVGLINYCVIVGDSDIEELTYRLSHEMVEQITNSDGSGWYGDPDPLVNRSLGAPSNARLEVCDYTAVPPESVQIHGWRVAPFAYEVDRTSDGFITKSAPLSDEVPASTPDHGRIRVDKKLTVTSCMGDVIEYQQAYFEATVTHYGQDQIISRLSWSAQSDPPDLPVAEVAGNTGRTYVLVIPIGCTSVTVQCFVQTAFLGCSLSVSQQFRVITQAQAAQAAILCALIDRLKQERWYDPLWWIKKFDPEYNPKATGVAEAIKRIAMNEGIDAKVAAEAKRIVLKDLAARIEGMVRGFRQGSADDSLL